MVKHGFSSKSLILIENMLGGVFRQLNPTS